MNAYLILFMLLVEKFRSLRFRWFLNMCKAHILNNFFLYVQPTRRSVLIFEIFAKSSQYYYSTFLPIVVHLWERTCQYWLPIFCSLFVNKGQASLKAPCTTAYTRIPEMSVIAYNSIKIEYHRCIGLRFGLGFPINFFNSMATLEIITN